MKFKYNVAVLSLCLSCSSVLAAVYNGENIDNNTYSCSGSIVGTPFNLKNMTCQFDDSTLTINAKHGGQDFQVPFQLEDEVITSNIFHFDLPKKYGGFPIKVKVDLDRPHQASNFFYYSRK